MDEKRMLEKNMLRALAIEFLMEYCAKRKYSVDLLEKTSFIYSYNMCGFFLYDADTEVNGLLNDLESQPKCIIEIIHENEELRIVETEHTKKFFGIQ